MASKPNTVIIGVVFPDGERIYCQAVAADSFPDALDEARKVASQGFREAVDHVLGCEYPETPAETVEPEELGG